MTVIEAIAMDDQIFQIVTLLCALFGLGLEIYQWRKEPSEKYWIFATLFWLSHVVFYYVWLTLDRYTTLNIYPFFGSYTLWSSILRMSVVVTFVVVEWYRIRQKELRKLKKELSEKLTIATAMETARELIIENQDLRNRLRIIIEAERKGKDVP